MVFVCWKANFFSSYNLSKPDETNKTRLSFTSLILNYHNCDYVSFSDNPCSSGVSDPTESSDTTQAQEEQSEFHRLGFTVFETPPMISRHPTPYDGRDDDINKLREVLTDVLVKTGKHPDFGNRDGSRILMAPDHKIAANFFKLLKEDELFLKFVPEFPLLHLRKSKITTLLSAYKTTGLGSILRYMQNSEETDLCKLIGLVNIEKGTNVIRRLTYALVIGIFISFLLSLSPEEASDLTRALAKDGLPDLWNQKFQKYVHERRDSSATFALHHDLLSHCEEVLAISRGAQGGWYKDSHCSPFVRLLTAADARMHATTAKNCKRKNRARLQTSFGCLFTSR